MGGEKRPARTGLPLLAFSALWVFLSTARLGAGPVLLLYDGAAGSSEAFKSARYISRLLPHVGAGDSEIIPVTDYRPGSLEPGGTVFLIFEEGVPSAPDRLLDDLASGDSTIVWIHSHIDGLLERNPSQWGIRFLGGMERASWTVLYKDRTFPKEDPWLNVVALDPSREISVHAWVADGEGGRYPYAVHIGRLWYFADSPFSFAVEGGRFLILADLLHEIFGVDHPPDHRALLRIEDVNPESDPASLKRITDYLHRRRIPFQISLIPVYRDPDLEVEVELSQRPELVEVLRYACSRGASLVLHGLTHQHRGATGDDYEFWDDISGRPIPHESAGWVDQRVRRGIALCARNGLYPLAWETPHYSGSREDYRTIAKYFSAFYDRVMAAELSGTQQIFPFPVRIDDPGILVIPENLGYIPLDDPDPDLLIQKADRMLTVRDGTASFFFHPFVPLRHLRKIVEEFRGMGWRFVSIREFGCRVRTDTLWAGTSGDRIQIRLENQFLHERLVDAGGKVVRDVYSAERETGMLSRRIDVPAGGYGVLEAVDLLPEVSDKGFPSRLVSGISGLLGRKRPGPKLNLSRVVVLMEAEADAAEDNDQRSFLTALRIFGFHPEEFLRASLPALNLREGDLLVAPYAAARRLSRRELNAVLDFTDKGGRLVTDGRTELAESLGIRFQGEVRPVGAVKDLSLPAPDLVWDPPVAVTPFGSSSELILARDAGSDVALAVIQSFRRGRVLFFGPLFDPDTPFGISRFPYFPYYLKNSLGLAFNARRHSLEFYFDPGFHQNTSWEKLVKRWRASGVRIVYLAAWHVYRDYRFDYDYFIRLCHEFGIAVFAWFELPQVTPLFWEEHPGWREKTADGRDARPHWRMLMNLFDPGARRAALDWVASMVADYDWDGINLAEINFDTDRGREDPAQFTPMNAEVRRVFALREGYDPVLFFDPRSSRHWSKNRAAFDRFLRFRADIVRDLHRDTLDRIYRVIRRKGKSMEVIVTAMDSLVHPEIYEECGIDTRDVIALMERFPFTLQIEDPARSWISPPDRYRAYREAYRDLVPDPGRLMFDINLIGGRDIAGRHLPSRLATGTELAATVYFAARGCGRVGIYSEATIHPLDMDLLPYVMSSDVSIGEETGGYVADAEAPFLLSGPDMSGALLMNGREWPFSGTAGIIVPSGRNRLDFVDRKRSGFMELTPRILLDADITDLRVSGWTYALRYDSPIPASLAFSRPPLAVRLDGAPLELSGAALGAILPRGVHELEIVTGSAPLEVIEGAGYLSSSLFYIFGLGSVMMLAALYVFIRIKH